LERLRAGLQFRRLLQEREAIRAVSPVEPFAGLLHQALCLARQRLHVLRAQCDDGVLCSGGNCQRNDQSQCRN
jgi:hypothetical protein